MQKIDKKFINGPYSESDYKTMKEVCESIIENPALQMSENLREKIAEIYKIEPAYAINDDKSILDSPLQQHHIDIIKRRYKHPTSAITFLEYAIKLLYQILKKIYDSEMQCDCNPLNYIVFDDPDDYIFLDNVIKEILHG